MDDALKQEMTNDDDDDLYLISHHEALAMIDDLPLPSAPITSGFVRCELSSSEFCVEIITVRAVLLQQ
jgi:hypothetical protein